MTSRPTDYKRHYWAAPISHYELPEEERERLRVPFSFALPPFSPFNVRKIYFSAAWVFVKSANFFFPA